MLLYNQHGNAWAEFALRSGPLGQTMTLCMKKEGSDHIEELITFFVYEDKLVYGSSNHKPVMPGKALTKEET
jgi:hypothetical protein